MRLFKLFSVALIALVAAGAASATVTINHTTTAASTTLNVGDTIAIRVQASWDGQGALIGIFSSTGVTSGDPAGVLAVSAVSGANLFRGSLFAFTDPDTGDATNLARFGQGQLRQAGDPTSAVRSVQYGNLAPILAGGAAANQLVTTITFQAVAPGTYTIGTINLLGDTGAQGDTNGQGSTVTITVNGPVIPEPGTALLMGLGLAGLGVAGRRR